MKTTTTTRPDILRITTTGVLGANSGVKVIAGGRLTVTKGFNEPTDSIEIETVDGMFKRAPRQTALINITFADGQIWSGDFSKLQDIIKAGESTPKKTFPNGFQSWQETYYKVVEHLSHSDENPECAAYFAASEGGTGRLFELAEQIADDFELCHQGETWEEKDYFDTLQSFLDCIDQNAFSDANNPLFKGLSPLT